MPWTPPRSVTDVDLRAIFLSLSSFLDGIVAGPGSVTSTTLAAGSVTTPKLADLAVTTAKLDDRSVTSDKVALGVIEDAIGTRVVTDAVTDGTITLGHWTVTSATANFTDLDLGKPIYASGDDGTAGVLKAVWKPGAYISAVISSTEVYVQTKNERQLTAPPAATGLKVSIGGLPRSFDVYTTSEDDSWGIRQYVNVDFTAGEQRTFGDMGHSVILDVAIDGHGQNVFPLTGYGPSGVYNIYGNVDYKTRAGVYGGGVSFLSNIWHGNHADLDPATDPDPFTVMFGAIMQPYVTSYGENLTYHGQLDTERTMLEGYVDQPVLQGQPRAGYWGTLDLRGFDETSFESDEFVDPGAVLGEKNGAWVREAPRLDLRSISMDNPGAVATPILAGDQLTIGTTGTFVFDTSVGTWPNAGEFGVYVYDNLTDRNFVGVARVTYTSKPASTGSGSTQRWYLGGCTVEDGPEGYIDDVDGRGRLSVATTYTSFASTTVTTTFGTSGFNGELGDEIVVGSNTSFDSTGYIAVASGGSTGESIIYYGGKSGSTKLTYCQIIEGGGTTLNGATLRQVYPATEAFWTGTSAHTLGLLDVTAWGSGVPALVDDFKFTVMADDGPWVGTYRAVTGSKIQYVTSYSKDRTWIRSGAQVSTAGIIQRKYGYRVDPFFRAQFGYPFLYGYSDTSYTWLMDKDGTDYKRLDTSASGLDRSIASYGNAGGVVQKFYAASGTPHEPGQLGASDSASEFWFYGRTGTGAWVDLASIRVEPSQAPGASAHGGSITFGLVQTGAATMTDALTLSFPTGSLPTGGLLADFAGRLQTASRLTVSAGGIYVTGASSITGALAMNTSKITGLGDPTAAQDAATKTYVDTAVAATAQSMELLFSRGADASSSTATGASWDTLYSDTIAAGTLAATGDFISARYLLTTASNTNTNRKARVRLNGTEIFNTSALTSPSAAQGTVDINVMIVRGSSATAGKCNATCSYDFVTGGDTNYGYVNVTVNNWTNSTNTLTLEAQSGSSSAAEWTARSAIIFKGTA